MIAMLSSLSSSASTFPFRASGTKRALKNFGIALLLTFSFTSVPFRHSVSLNTVEYLARTSCSDLDASTEWILVHPHVQHEGTTHISADHNWLLLQPVQTLGWVRYCRTSVCGQNTVDVFLSSDRSLGLSLYMQHLCLVPSPQKLHLWSSSWVVSTSETRQLNALSHSRLSHSPFLGSIVVYLWCTLHCLEVFLCGLHRQG